MHSNASLFPSVNEKERRKANPIKALAETRHLLSLEMEGKNPWCYLNRYLKLAISSTLILEAFWPANRSFLFTWHIPGKWLFGDKRRHEKCIQHFWRCLQCSTPLKSSMANGWVVVNGIGICESSMLENPHALIYLWSKWMCGAKKNGSTFTKGTRTKTEFKEHLLRTTTIS